MAANAPYNAGIFTQILTLIDHQISQAMTTGIIGDMLTLLQYLGGLEVILLCIGYMMMDEDQFIGDLFVMGVRIGVYAQLLSQLNSLARLFTDGCIYYGLLIGGIPYGIAGWTPFTVEQFHDPGAIMLSGWVLFTPLMTYLANVGVLGAAFHTVTITLYAIVALCGWFCILVIGLCVLVAWVEFWALIPWGVILFSFTIFRHTAFLGEGVLMTLAGCGIRLGVLAMMLGLSFPLLTSLQVTDATDPDLSTALALCGIAIVFAILVWKIPAFSARLTGSAPIYYGQGFRQMGHMTMALATKGASAVGSAVGSSPQPMRVPRGA